MYFSVQVLAMSSVLQEGEDSSVPRVPSARPWGVQGVHLQYNLLTLN